MRASTWLIIGALALVLLGGGKIVYDMTRGLRNNNPLNIRRSKDKWLGLAADQTDPDFFQFETPEYGIRAASIILRGYRTRYNITTLRGIIARWAPPSENDTDAYIKSVSQRSGIGPDDNVSDADIPALIGAMVTQENGVNPYQLATIERGVQLA